MRLELILKLQPSYYRQKILVLGGITKRSMLSTSFFGILLLFTGGKMFGPVFYCNVRVSFENFPTKSATDVNQRVFV